MQEHSLPKSMEAELERLGILLEDRMIDMFLEDERPISDRNQGGWKPSYPGEEPPF